MADRIITKDEAFDAVLGDGKCERYTGNSRCSSEERRRVDAYFEDDKICDRCIMDAAANGAKVRWADECEKAADALHAATTGDGSERDKTLRRLAKRIEEQHRNGYHAFLPADLAAKAAGS